MKSFLDIISHVDLLIIYVHKISNFFGVLARSVKVLYNIYMTVLLPIRKEKAGEGWSW